MQNASGRTPAEMGFRMPAEWEPHEATWLCWPHRLSDWPGKFVPIRWVYGEIVRKLAPSETVRVLVKSPGQRRQAEHILGLNHVDLSRVEFHEIPTDRGWMRDISPQFVKSGTDLALVRFRFNGWAKYPDHTADAAFPRRVAEMYQLLSFDAVHKGVEVVLEGGSIDVNGQGTLLTTEECLLDTAVQCRNPALTRQDIETVFRDCLGVSNVLWLGKGIAGDDTHGHVDDLCRFVSPDTVVLALEKNSSDVNYAPLMENYERLQSMRLENGGRINVVPLPMPAPLHFDDMRLPASYANFYIADQTVLVPTFNDPNDRLALGILADLFPTREVVGINAVDLVWGLGTLHCLTHEHPA